MQSATPTTATTPCAPKFDRYAVRRELGQIYRDQRRFEKLDDAERSTFLVSFDFGEVDLSQDVDAHDVEEKPGSKVVSLDEIEEDDEIDLYSPDLDESGIEELIWRGCLAVGRR